MLPTSFNICGEYIAGVREGEALQLVTLLSHLCGITHVRVIAHTDDR